MKKCGILLWVISIILLTTLPVFAAGGAVIYDGNAREFIFAPGGDTSLTDLFSELKDVMPGDSLTQKIMVKNDGEKDVKVRLYLRALGAQADSTEFLSQLSLKVKVAQDHEAAYLFAAAAHETAQLTDWLCLGTLYSGCEVELDVTLEVSTELGNDFQNQIGYLDWEWKAQELPVEPTDPQPPQTGDSARPGLWLAMMAVSAGIVVLLLVIRKKKETQNPRKAG